MALFGGGELSPDAILKRLESRSFRNPTEKRELLERLKQVGELRADLLMRLLMGGDPELSRFAVERFEGVRDPRVLDQLLQALGEARGGRERPILAAILKLDSPRLSERIGQMLASKRANQRRAGLEVLSQLPDWADHLQHIKTALRDEETALRKRAVQLLRRAPEHSPAWRLLREQLRNPDAVVRHEAIEAAAQNPDPELVEDLFDMLPEEPARVREVVFRGLARLMRQGGSTADRIFERVLPLLAAEDEGMRKGAATLIASMPDKLQVLRRFMQYAKGLAFWLRDRSFSAVAAVARDLGEALLDLMRDNDTDIVAGAVVMAGKSRDPRLLAGLEEVLQRDFDWWVKIPTLETVAGFQHPTVVMILLDALENEELRTAALGCLGKRGDPVALAAVTPFLTDPRRGTRIATISALPGFRDSAVIGPLEQVARDDPDHECRIRALETLEQFGPEGVSAAAAVREERRAVIEAGASSGRGPALKMVNDDLNS